MEYKLELFGHTVYGEEQIIWEQKTRLGCIPGKGSTGRQKLAKRPEGVTVEQEQWVVSSYKN